jgi:hypothetical protein
VPPRRPSFIAVQSESGELDTIDAKYVERHDGDPAAVLHILVTVEGEDA